MIVGFPTLGTRWSDFLITGPSAQARSAMVGSDGCVYHVLTDDTVPTTRVRRMPSASNIYSFPAYSMSYTTTHLVPTAHGDWIYQCNVSLVSATFTLTLYAYNPVLGTAKTVKATTDNLEHTPYTISAMYRWSDVAIDPVTGIGLCMIGYSITYVYVVHHSGGGPVEPWDEYITASENVWILIDFTAGSGATEPAYVGLITSGGSTTAASTTVGLVGAYNDIGLYYNPTTGAYMRIPTISTPTAGSSYRASVTPLSLIVGPNLFRDSASATTIRDSEGLTWTISGVGSGLVSYYEFEVIGSTSTLWIINLLAWSGGDGAVVHAICSLAKAGTTFAVLDQVVTGYTSTSYLKAWDSYLIGKSPFLGYGSWAVDSFIPLHEHSLIEKLLRLPYKESV